MKLHKPPFELKECKIELTYNCTLSCVHCSSDARDGHPLSMTKKKCLEIIDEALELGIKKLSFSGGEPLLWDGIEEAIRKAAKCKVKVSVYSSGNIHDQIDKIKAIKDSGCEKIIFSVFGSKPSIHEKITRIRGSYQKTLTAARTAVKFGIQTEFHFVPLSNNYRQLPNIIDMAKKYGVKTISILRLVAQGRAQLISGQALNKIQNMELKKMIEDGRNNHFPVRTGSPYNFLLLNSQPKCASAIDRVIIGPDLRIYPCDAFKQIRAEELVGTLDYSVLDKYTLKECWDSSPFLHSIRKYLTTDFDAPCKSCEKLELCLSGCLAQKVLRTADLRKQPDPMCLYRI